MTMPFPATIADTRPSDNGLRIGVVAQSSPLQVNVQGGLVENPGVLGGEQFAVGTTVALLRQDQTWLVLGSVATSDVVGMTGQAAYNDSPGVDTVAIGTYTNLGTTTAFPWTKRLDTTKVRIDFAVSCFLSVAANTTVRFGVDILGATNYRYTATEMTVNPLATHTFLVGGILEAGVDAGVYSIQPIWLRVAGGGTVNTDANDWLSMIVSEVT